VSVETLEREIYSEAEAARLLGLPQGTLNYWLEGGERRGKTYRPILRPEPKGTRSVTWAEFVEAALLREYRRTHGVPMAELRAFIETLRDSAGVPYPLAHKRPFVGVGRQLVLEAQRAAALDGEFWLVAWADEQLILTHPAQEFVERVAWEGDVASGWRPHDDPRSPVRIDPEVRFGRPAVCGVATEVLWEHAEGGEDNDEIAKAFDLDLDAVRWALSYENAARAKALSLAG
jgi:uncharacterized protein (DUF433 family)